MDDESEDTYTYRHLQTKYLLSNADVDAAKI